MHAISVIPRRSWLPFSGFFLPRFCSCQHVRVFAGLAMCCRWPRSVGWHQVYARELMQLCTVVAEQARGQTTAASMRKCTEKLNPTAGSSATQLTRSIRDLRDLCMSEVGIPAHYCEPRNITKTRDRHPSLCRVSWHGKGLTLSWPQSCSFQLIYVPPSIPMEAHSSRLMHRLRSLHQARFPFTHDSGC